jgi:hypothetical protein
MGEARIHAGKVAGTAKCNVRFGSITDMAVARCDVRRAPGSGQLLLTTNASI